MTSLGFENYAEALKIYLAKYRDVCCSLPPPSKKKKTKNKKEDPSPSFPTLSSGYGQSFIFKLMVTDD